MVKNQIDEVVYTVVCLCAMVVYSNSCVSKGQKENPKFFQLILTLIYAPDCG